MLKAASILASAWSALIFACAMAAIFAQPAAAQTIKKLNCTGCVKSKQLKDEGVRSKDIKNGQVKNADLGANSVDASKIVDGTVGNADLAANAVTSGKIADGAVTADKLSDDALAGGPRPIEDCGTVDQPGSYVLVNDLPGPSGLNLDGGCLVIEADGVTLDLAGFSIVGNRTGDPAAADGVFMNGRSDVTIRNGTIRDFGADGIDARDDPRIARNQEVSDIRSIDNVGAGIILRGENHQVTNCLARGNGNIGIFVDDGATVTGNTVNDNGEYGIFSGAKATVTSNTTVGNDRDGMNVSSNSVVASNTASGNRGHGILAGSGSAVAGNRASENGGAGIGAGLNSSVTGNTAIGNTDEGIVALSDSAVAGNVATGNGGTNIVCDATCSLAGNIPPP